ncbi:hypothetical protein [Sneathiella litorea]|uniref:Uncharacterized protein n=1 Tax=Sneathiella litorea TaxID=2606216 RepID=A0A6L8W5P9_9PROT|nr:hypothetical protein [Sneathiella litorea]MZR29813.1 hypothetical protein [Sneathiella litorea]
MSINPVTHDQYAYLDRALPSDPIAQYVPKERVDENGDKIPADNGFGEDGFGFDDFLDIINPLQHIPGISSLYRELTGDEINPGARTIGGTIYGGAIGLAVSFINSTIEDVTGKDVGKHVISLFSDEGEEAAPEEMIAAAPSAIEATPAAAPVDLEKAPAAMPPIVTAPLASPMAPAPTQPDALAEEMMPGVSPIGLEWKGDKPALLQQLEKANTQDLTEAQLHAVFKSFGTAPSALEIPTVEAKAASAAYQKTTAAMATAASPVVRPIAPMERPAP